MKLLKAFELFIGTYNKESTRRAYETTIRPLVTALGPIRDVTSVTPADLIAYANELKTGEVRYLTHPTRPNQKKRISAATYNKQIKGIKRFFNWLVEIDELTVSPAGKLKKEKLPRAVDREAKAATPEEIQMIFMATFGHTRNYALVRFLADTGCRAGGASGLRIKDVDLTNRKAIVTEKGDKTRPVWFSDETAKWLGIWLAERPVWDHDYVFGSKDGNLSSSSVSQIVRRACKKARIRSLGAHALRHAKGFALSDKKVSPTVAAVALGHDSPQTTMDSYYPQDYERAEQAIRETHEPSKIVHLKRKTE